MQQGLAGSRSWGSHSCGSVGTAACAIGAVSFLLGACITFFSCAMRFMQMPTN